MNRGVAKTGYGGATGIRRKHISTLLSFVAVSDSCLLLVDVLHKSFQFIEVEGKCKFYLISASFGMFFHSFSVFLTVYVAVVSGFTQFHSFPFDSVQAICHTKHNNGGGGKLINPGYYMKQTHFMLYKIYWRLKYCKIHCF
jgi:hypothetical protein